MGAVMIDRRTAALLDDVESATFAAVWIWADDQPEFSGDDAGRVAAAAASAARAEVLRMVGE